jgi:sulfite reductase alpha subunit-like flavoprotein
MADSPPLLILYATETGTAQDVADTIARHCRRLLLHARIMSIDSYPLAELVAEGLVVFVISTTGSGQEPRSMTPFWNMLLRSDLPNDLFEDMTFAVFGVGDTAYEKFCWPAKKLRRRLLTLGAVEVCENGEGDEQHLFHLPAPS